MHLNLPDIELRYVAPVVLDLARLALEWAEACFTSHFRLAVSCFQLLPATSSCFQLLRQIGVPKRWALWWQRITWAVCSVLLASWKRRNSTCGERWMGCTRHTWSFPWIFNDFYGFFMDFFMIFSIVLIDFDGLSFQWFS